jgi:hypothetical protein
MHQSNQEYNSQEKMLFIDKLKHWVWLLGIIAWVFAIADRVIAAFADNHFSNLEIIQFLTNCFFFWTWLYLKPETHQNEEDCNQLSIYGGQSSKLRQRHMISQEYILPFPHLCQIYHLLNLKHLETIHKFSLNNLKIANITHSQPTQQGGMIKFQTVLDSPINALRIFRQEFVEVDLILHNPYTVELSIPVYNSKRVNIVFNALPLTSKEHYFFIDIYSDLEWCKPFLQVILHFATSLTLFEDLPYLRALAERNIENLFYASKFSSHETMYLYNRFVELYGSNTKISLPA